MKIGTVKEIKQHEYRVGLTPDVVAAFVAAGQPAQIEHHRLNRRLHMFFHRLVSGENERGARRIARLRNAFPCPFNGLCLHIERIHMPAFAHQLTQEQGVLAVAHRRVDNRIPLADSAAHIIRREMTRIAQDEPFLLHLLSVIHTEFLPFVLQKSLCENLYPGISLIPEIAFIIQMPVRHAAAA